MSDLYNEATRHDYIKVPRYLFFLGGGLVAVLFVARKRISSVWLPGLRSDSR